METQTIPSTAKSPIAPAGQVVPSVFSPRPADVLASPGSVTPAGSTARMPATTGQLADEAQDVMVLHTQEAYRLFVGRAGDESAHTPAIAGGRRFAAVMRSLWHLSANDNPYADWILVEVYRDLLEVRTRMRQAIEAREAEFERLRQRGLRLTVLASRSPLSVALGFRSPYGYATAEAILDFDFYVRMVKTLVMKDRLSDDDGRAAIREIGRVMRALFLAPIRWERVLLRDEMVELSRRDYLPGADDSARLRIRAAVAVFGEVPRDVFTGAEAPRHTQRRQMVNPAEFRLLAQVPLTVDDGLPSAPETLV